MQSVLAQLTDDANILLGTKFMAGTYPIPITGNMNEAEFGRVHQYFDDNELRHGPVEITFPAGYIDAPVSLHILMRLTHIDTGWQYTIRHIDAPYMADGQSFVHVLAVTMTGK